MSVFLLYSLVLVVYVLLQQLIVVLCRVCLARPAASPFRPSEGRAMLYLSRTRSVCSPRTRGNIISPSFTNQQKTKMKPSGSQSIKEGYYQFFFSQ